MSGKPIVYLEDIADTLEVATDGWVQYLNTATGEFVEFSDGTYIEKDEELAEKVESSSDYVELPSQYNIHEYKIMENFAEDVMDIRKRDQLFRALDGKKPFRYFKDTLFYTELADAYYAFRTRALVRIAEDWCIGNGIPYKSRNKQKGE